MATQTRWSMIAQQLPGRTDNDVKNYWNTKLRKKLLEMGIDPVTHKPFSQIFADYGNIGGIPKHGNQIGSLNRDLKIAFCMKLEKHRTQPEEFMPTLVSPKTEPIIQHTNNHPLDLLTELQAIKMVTEFSNCTNLETIPPPHIFSQNSTFSASSSSSASSTCSSTAAREKSQLNFSWRDFLLEDAFVPIPDNQEQENLFQFTSKKFEIEAPIDGFQGSSSSNGSFVENLLDQDNEMLLEFPDLLEEPFYY